MTEYPHHPDFEPKSLDPLENEAEIVADCCEDGVDGITLFVGEVVAVHSVFVFEVTDDRFDRCPSPHLAFDCRCHAAFLACGEDLELMFQRCVVAFVTGIRQDALKGSDRKSSIP